MQALITGGTGFIGRHLAKQLPDPVIAGRDKKKIQALLPDFEARSWNPAKPIEPSFLTGVDTIFHLAGESIFKGRWNAAKKERIRASRTKGTRRLVDAIADARTKPRVLISSSAVGIYGDRADDILHESSQTGTDFLARVCRQWEEEALRAHEYGVRVVLIRTGVVLGRDGGALAQMLPAFRFALGGRLGSGNQYMSWIHRDDLCRVMIWAMKNDQVHGPINGVAPTPVTNREFTRALTKAVARPALLPIPEFLLKLLLGEFATVLLSSQRVLPKALQKNGFRFHYPDITSTLANLVAGS